MRRLRSLAKRNASKLIGAVARKMAGVPISMTVKIKRLAGTTRVWIPAWPGTGSGSGSWATRRWTWRRRRRSGRSASSGTASPSACPRRSPSSCSGDPAALVLPNGGNLILDPLTPFDAVPEVSVHALLAMGKTSQASCCCGRRRARRRLEGASTRAPRRARRGSPARRAKPTGRSPTDPGALLRRARRLSTRPARVCRHEAGDAARAVVPGGKEEDDAEEAVAAMVDSFRERGNSPGALPRVDDDVDDDATRRDATDEWTHSSPSAGVSRTRTGEISANQRRRRVHPRSCTIRRRRRHARLRGKGAAARAARRRRQGGGGTIDVRFGAPRGPARRGDDERRPRPTGPRSRSEWTSIRTHLPTWRPTWACSPAAPAKARRRRAADRVGVTPRAFTRAAARRRQRRAGRREVHRRQGRGG